MASRGNAPIKVFIAHADQDRGFAEELIEHLEALVKSGSIEVWAPFKVLVGGDGEGEVSQRIGSAELILLMMTRYLLASPAHEHLIERALKLEHQARIVPVLTTSCDWKTPALDRFQPVPLLGQAILSKAKPVDEAWTEVAKAVRLVVDVMLAARKIEPVPHFIDETDRALVEQIDKLREERDELSARGDDTSYVYAQIKQLKIQLREKGQLIAGELLSDRFRLLANIGQGGFGRVWTAFDQQRKEILAVKILHTHLASPGHPQRLRFEQGAAQMAKLKHHAIVRVLDLPTEDRGYVYYTMEYLPGGDLRQAVLSNRLTHDETLAVFSDIASALTYAHKRNIVHRDVKPANILLDANKSPKLTDFDLVSVVDSFEESRTGPLGSLIYASPEAMVDASKATELSDVYSLGMTMLFVLHNAELPVDKILREPQAFLESLFLGERLRQAIGKAIEGHMGDRWQSVSDLHHAVKLAFQGEGERLKDVFLRIEVLDHTSSISRISVDGAERFAVTGALDKTVRIWDLTNRGALIRTLRPPIDHGVVGCISAVAISPDGRWIAASCFKSINAITENIYIFDRTSGELYRRISGLLNHANHLVFSPDNLHLAAALDGTGGIQILRVRDGRTVNRQVSVASSFGATFASDQRLATTSYDGHIRLFSSDLQKVSKVRSRGGKEPYGIAFSPSNRQLAVSYNDSCIIDVFSGQDLKFLYCVTADDPRCTFQAVAWSPDGRDLFAAGGSTDSGVSKLTAWSQAGRGPRRDLSGSMQAISALCPLRRGRLAFSTNDSLWGVLNAADGGAFFKRTPTRADFRGMHSDLKTSANGREISFKFDNIEPGVHFSLTKLKFEWGNEPKNLHAPRSKASHLEFKNWKDASRLHLNDRILKLGLGERVRSLAISADGNGFLIGADRSLRLFHRDGTECWRNDVPGTPWAVNITLGGLLGLAAFADGTIRYFRTKDGKELLAFFSDPATERWVLWTPSGYYDANATGGEELFGWHVNRGPDCAADFYSAAKFRSHFYRPAVVANILETLDEELAVLRAGGPW